MRKQLLGWLALILLWSLLWGCQRSNEGEPTETDGSSQLIERNSQPVAVEAAVISSDQFFDAITVSGIVQGVREVTIISETSGKVSQVRAGLGQRVFSNQILVQLDSEVERFAVAQASDQLKVADLELRAVKDLVANNSSSPAELARVTAAASGARSTLAQAQKRLDNKVIRSPLNGEIAVLPDNISPGNYIQPGGLIARVVDLNRLRLAAGVGERDILLIEIGAAANVTLSACGETPQPAQITNIAAGSASNDGNFIVVVEWNNNCGNKVKSGMSATVRITPSGGESSDTVVVPTAAILREGSQEYLYLVTREGDVTVARRANIESGKQFANRTEVISGVAEGDLLIVAPLQSLNEGSLVEATSIGSTIFR